MAKVFIEETSLSAIGDAIRGKTGGTELMSPAAMATAISNIETGGGGGDLPEEAFVITGDCRYKFANNGWKWFIENYGNQITTSEITNLTYMFNSSNELESIPFDINVASAIDGSEHVFTSCTHLRYLPELNIVPTMENYKLCSGMYQNCYSLREIQPEWLSIRGGGTNANYTIYGYMFYYCYVLDEIVNLAVQSTNISYNVFSSTFYNCYRLKNITFETNEDGSAKAVGWKNQTIDLSSDVGYVSIYRLDDITNFNSGITLDKQVTDAASYEALKNDPDWFTADINYSRYNHDSAVNTINSLPDVASSGQSATIKFSGESGALTDGGAINTLTEEEIAVATAKGWTITLV